VPFSRSVAVFTCAKDQLNGDVDCGGGGQ